MFRAAVQALELLSAGNGSARRSGNQSMKRCFPGTEHAPDGGLSQPAVHKAVNGDRTETPRRNENGPPKRAVLERGGTMTQYFTRNVTP
jgi:hypothetical protein